MRRLLGEAPRQFFLHYSLSPNRTADEPTPIINAEIGGQSSRYVLLGIPDGHNLEVLDRGIFNPRLVYRLLALPDQDLEGAFWPLNYRP